MNEIVLDASAILAIIQREPGHEALTPDLLAHATASAVNVAEVHGKLISRGWSSQEAWEDAISPLHRIVSFDSTYARIVGDLVSLTKQLGLSLGDRACLALGIALKVPVYTAEKAWKKLRLGAEIQVIR
ncbi:MAG TPA: type II toxin-antitoxin system VapC family toxin [Terriglobales bacterium]|nr:type II toxin-antitoxin system VapC family toxin [Terriglobales bacterium]